MVKSDQFVQQAVYTISKVLRDNHLGGKMCRLFDQSQVTERLSVNFELYVERDQEIAISLCREAAKVLAYKIIGDRQMWPYHFTGFGEPTGFLFELPLPGGLDMAAKAKDEMTNVAVRFLRGFDISDNMYINQLDCMISRK